MIYQHRLIVAREGRLEKRHEAFEQGAMKMLEQHGSQLIGAWEVLVGPDAGSSVYQIRQFQDLPAWSQHQAKVRNDAVQVARRAESLYTTVDLTDTAILQMHPLSPSLPADWPPLPTQSDNSRAVFQQRTIWIRPADTDTHYSVYFNEVLPALNICGSTHLSYFETLIGPGSTNGASHRSVELRRFPNATAWEEWMDIQRSDPALRKLVRLDWSKTISRIDSVLMKPMKYSRMR
jgi:hypothetical protein